MSTENENSVLYLQSVDSTNEMAKRLEAYVETVPLAIVADRQTKGRGSKGRTWYSASEGGLYFSLLLRPATFDFALLDLYHTKIGEYLVRLIGELTGISVQMEWPNDIILEHKKCGGILIETAGGSGTPRFVVVGIGLNLNQVRFPKPLRLIATSLRQKTGIIYDKQSFIDALVKELSYVFERN